MNKMILRILWNILISLYLVTFSICFSVYVYFFPTWNSVYFIISLISWMLIGTEKVRFHLKTFSVKGKTRLRCCLKLQFLTWVLCGVEEPVPIKCMACSDITCLLPHSPSLVSFINKHLFSDLKVGLKLKIKFQFYMVLSFFCHQVLIVCFV